jgi:2-C-methyl-D-erythritol 2,4-cyclodiphosphate synthase
VTRIGIGYDMHPFEDGRRLVLGGVVFEGERGLCGHSDGDALVHAIIDAILGAAGLGDIGQHFPSGDERWRGADSIEMLREVAALAAKAGFSVGNLDATVIAERPRIAPRAAEMRDRVARAVGCDGSRVSIKATTTDGLGAIGRGDGLAAMAVALLLETTHSA